MAKWIKVKQEDFDRLSEMWRWYQRSHGRVEKFTDDHPEHGPRDEHDKRVWFRATAASASVGDAPAYGVVKIANFHFDDAESRPYLTFEKPDADNLTNCGVVWHSEIKNGKVGRVTLEPWWALYDESDTPAFDEAWGTSADSWELTQGNTGFKILGAATDGRVLVRRPESTSSVNVIKFSLTQALTVSDETATASLDFVVTGTGPSGSFSVTNMEASSNYAFAGITGAKGYAIQRTSDSAWLIIQMECG